MALWLAILLIFISFAAGFIASALLREKENEQTENTLADIHTRLRLERRRLRASTAARSVSAGTKQNTLRRISK